MTDSQLIAWARSPQTGPAPRRSTPNAKAALAVTDVVGRATITVAEAADLLGVGRSAAYEAARRGQLPTRRVGRKLLVPVPALLAWLGTDGDGGRRTNDEGTRMA